MSRTVHASVLFLVVAIVLSACAGPADGTDTTAPASDVPDVTSTDLAAETTTSCICGNGACEAICGESIGTCPFDCKACGDKECSPSEGPIACPIDCCGGCGDGLCLGYDCGENPETCPADCSQPCGDKVCGKGETPQSCPVDCAWQVCGNGVCEPADGGATGCPKDCATGCGDCKCEGGEDWLSCPIDCGYCGDAVCSACERLHETSATCPKDCGPVVIPDSDNDVIEPADVPAAETTPADAPAAARQLAFADPMDDAGKPTEGTSSFYLTIGYLASRDLSVVLTQAGAPLADVGITYEILDDPLGLCELSAALVVTGADGTAQASLASKVPKIGKLQVRVCVADDPVVPCLTFDAAVTPTDYAPLMVGFAPYTGKHAAELTAAEVRLFRQGADGRPKCAELDLAALPTATVVAPPMSSLAQTATFAELPNLEADLTQYYTIAGFAKTQAGVVEAWGCNDTDGKVEWGAQTHVSLVLADIPPHLEGTYDLTSSFDMVSGLPPEVANVVYTITGFFMNPAAEILKLICNAAGGNQTMNDFCGYLFNDPSNPVITELTATGEIVFQIVNALLIGILESYCPFADKTLCSKVYWTGNDVSFILTKFQLLSTMQVNCEPDAAGVLAADCVEESWHSVRLRWTLGVDCPPNDDNCGWKKFEFSQISGMESTISAKPAVTVVDQKMTIAKHPLDLKYGALINFALEKWLLPMLLGDGSDGLPVVDSYEAMIGSLLAGKACLADGTCCEAFAENVAKQATGVTKNLVEGACEALITTGSNYLRNTLTGLAASPEAFKLGTKAPCQLYDKNKDMKYDAIGQNTSPCEWDAAITFGATEYAPVGTFWGVRK